MYVAYNTTFSIQHKNNTEVENGKDQEEDQGGIFRDTSCTTSHTREAAQTEEAEQVAAKRVEEEGFGFMEN